MWKLYRQTKAFNRPPSAVMGIDPENVWLCWQFDNAVETFGSWVEGKLSERNSKGKPKHEIEDLLKLPRRIKPIPAAYVSEAKRGGMWD